MSVETNIPDGEEVLTVPELCQLLRVGKDAVYAGCKAPEPYRWPHYRAGRGIRAGIRVLRKDIPVIRELLSGVALSPKPAAAPVDSRSAERLRGAQRLVRSR